MLVVRIFDLLDEFGNEFQREDTVFTTWWTTQDAVEFEYIPLLNSVSWTVAPQEGEVIVYARVGDSLGAESLGWLVFDVAR